MMRETYRGVALKVQKGSQRGYTRCTIGGVCEGDSMGTDEGKVLESLRRWIDAAHDDERDGCYPAHYFPKSLQHRAHQVA